MDNAIVNYAISASISAFAVGLGCGALIVLFITRNDKPCSTTTRRKKDEDQEEDDG